MNNFELYISDYDGISYYQCNHLTKTNEDFKLDCELLLNEYMDMGIYDGETNNEVYFDFSDYEVLEYMKENLHRFGYTDMEYNSVNLGCDIGVLTTGIYNDNRYKEHYKRKYDTCIDGLSKIYSKKTIDKLINLSVEFKNTYNKEI